MDKYLGGSEKQPTSASFPTFILNMFADLLKAQLSAILRGYGANN